MDDAPDTPVGSLRNLGPASAAWLAEVGIRTRADLAAAGPVLVYRALKHVRPEVSLNLLYAMEGALTDTRWDRLAVDVRARLKREAAEALRIPPAAR